MLRMRMNKIDDLVREMCPDGVEYVKIKDVTEMKRGTSLTKAQAQYGDIPVISGGKEPAFFCDRYNREGETITVAGSGASAGYVQYWNIPIYANDCFTIKGKENILTKYIYYFLKKIQNKIHDTKKGGGIPHVHISDVEDFKIPLPPLEIQERIVNILDKFTDLTKELIDKLKNELDLRKKQYEYYRDYLLTFDCTIDRIRIKDVADISRGQRLEKSDLSENGEYAAYQNALSPMGYYNSKNRNGGSVYLIGAGAAGSIGFSENDFWAADDCYTFECNEKITQKYLFYVLLNSKVNKASIEKISRESIENIEIPIPSLDVQNRLVEVLDNFDAICSDLNIILPAEIEARQQQYEYYRDVLLTYTATGNINVRQIDRQNIIRLIQYVFGYVMLPLCEICQSISSGKAKMKDDVGEYPVYGSTGIIARTDIAVYTKTNILVARVGANAGYTHVAYGDYDVSDNTLIVDVKNDFNLKYVYYQLVNIGLNRYAKGGGQPLVTAGQIKNVVIPVPETKDQEKIVAILDRFDALCNDLTKGLPAEIEARQKQYEYYRDKLLSFE